MVVANCTVFGERVPLLRRPPPALPAPPSLKFNDRFGNPKPDFLSHRLLLNKQEPPTTVEEEEKKKTKKVVRRKVVVKRVKKKKEEPYKPKFIPNLPDKILWHIFDMLDYKSQCKAESVSRHWQRLIRNKHKREIKDLSIEMLGSRIQVLQQKAFKRLSITCPDNAFDFLSGVMRRSHALLSTLTCDFMLLANASKLSFETEGRWKYFSGVEQLWLLVTKCPSNLLASFCQIEADLFTDLTNLTIQIHSGEDLENVRCLVKTLTGRNPAAEFDLELHANNGSQILRQLDHLENVQLNRLKLVCSALNAAPLSLPLLVDQFQKSNITFKKIVFLEWYLNFDQNAPIVTQPVQLLHIDSCSINRSKEMVGSLYRTMTQKRKKKTPVNQSLSESEDGAPKPKKATKKVIRKKVHYIKKLEMAGSINCCDLLFLASKQHIELEEQIQRRVPDLTVDTSEIYYFE